MVFGAGAVRIVNEPDAERALRTMRVPLALVMPGAFQSDPQHGGQEPGLQVGTAIVRVATTHRGDEIGELAIIGGHRGSTTVSQGAGLMQIEPEVFAAIGQLEADDGIEIQFRDFGEQGTFTHAEHKNVGWQDYIFEAVCTRT